MGLSVGILLFFLTFFITFLKMSGGFGPLLKGAAGVLPSLAPVLGKLAEEPIKKIESGVLALGRSGYRKHNIFFIWPKATKCIPLRKKLFKIFCSTNFFEELFYELGVSKIKMYLHRK